MLQSMASTLLSCTKQVGLPAGLGTAYMRAKPRKRSAVQQAGHAGFYVGRQLLTSVHPSRAALTANSLRMNHGLSSAE